MIAPYRADNGEIYFLTPFDIAYVMQLADATGAEKKLNELLNCLTISQTRLAKALRTKNRLADLLFEMEKEFGPLPQEIQDRVNAEWAEEEDETDGST